MSEDGEVIDLYKARRARAGTPETRFVALVGTVGQIIVRVDSDPGNEACGPYHLALMTPGMPDHRLFTITPNDVVPPGVTLQTMVGLAEGIVAALRFADANIRWLPSTAPPEPA